MPRLGRFTPGKENHFPSYTRLGGPQSLSSTSCSSSGEKTVSVQPLVAVTLCRWPCRVQVGSELPTCTRHGYRQVPEFVLTRFVSPDDEHDVLETCRELKI